MDQFIEGTMDTREIIKGKLRQCFDGKIVRKDLTKKIKEGANVPVYVLEFLLGQYCSSDDEEVIEKGVENVKRILADNFVRPDEAQKILSMLRSRSFREGVPVSDEVLNYLATRIKSNFRELEGALISLTAHATLAHKDITVELAESITEKIIGEDYAWLSLFESLHLYCIGDRVESFTPHWAGFTDFYVSGVVLK